MARAPRWAALNSHGGIHIGLVSGVAGKLNLFLRGNPMRIFVIAALLAASGIASVAAQTSTNTTTLAAGATIGNVSSTAAFTAGATSTVNGYVNATAAVTLG